jgi:hypothetical protein
MVFQPFADGKPAGQYRPTGIATGRGAPHIADDVYGQI